MRVLLIGKGAREHALAWKLARSPLLSKLYVWPGHAAMTGLAEGLPVPRSAPWPEVVEASQGLGVDLVVCGPEAALADGLADMMAAAGIHTFGPSKMAAQLEASKAFAKRMMIKAGVPTAAFELASSEDECRKLAFKQLECSDGVVLKASGLAAGKGVFVCRSKSDIGNGLHHLYHTGMQAAATTVVVEELLTGRECSYFTFIGNEGSHALGFAVDYKRLEDGDLGPNTGGMGCYTPVPWLPTDAGRIVDEQVVTPLMRALAEEGITYCGCLYVGLMWHANGPKVIEFNVRLGDPEAQVLAVNDDRDWLALMAAKAGLVVPHASQPWLPEHTGDSTAAVCVVLASPGYPFGEGEQTGVLLPADLFTGRMQGGAGTEGATQVFAAAVEGEVLPVTSGSGRVLSVVARAGDFATARAQAYQQVESIQGLWPKVRFRRDIAMRTQ